MIVEHHWITTLEHDELLATALRVVEGVGFTQSDSGEGFVEATRGKTNPARARSVDQLPQRIRIEFDRGKVTVAASVIEHRKKGSLARDMALALVAAVEGVTARGMDLDEATRDWDRSDEAIRAAAKKEKLLLYVFAAALIAALIAIAAMIAVNV